MHYKRIMNVALTTSHGRMASCFSGVELRVVRTQSDPQALEVVATRAWHPLLWGRELMRRDVSILLCAGIDQIVWAGIRGYGIDVIPNAMGESGYVLSQWLSGQLVPPQTWDPFPYTKGYGSGRAGWGKRFRGGRG